MKKISFLLALFIPSILFGQEKAGVSFNQDLSWTQLLIKAKAENKYIFVDAYTTWCGPCKMMDNDVYNKKVVGDTMNGKFISVKVQIDRTNNDNPIIKKWYNDAESIKTLYHINAFPCFLFFSPGGDLIYRDVGYRNPEKFIQLTSFASDPSRKNFREQLVAYMNGVKNYAIMPQLSMTTRSLLDDRELAFIMAKDYKDNYLDKLNKENFLTKDNIQFIKDNGSVTLVNSSDHLFKTSYSQPQLVDSLIGESGFSKSIVDGVIVKEEILLKLYNNDSAITKNPNWKVIKRQIAKKYPKVNSEDLVFNQRIDFFRKTENWTLYTFYKSKQIQMCPPNPEGSEIFFGLNGPAWDLFLHCSDTKALRHGLEWIELALKLDKQNHRYQYIDTKANLLYKLGKVNEAIAVEKQAIEALEQIALRENRPRNIAGISNFQGVIKKMKEGLPTWPTPSNK